MDYTPESRSAWRLYPAAAAAAVAAAAALPRHLFRRAGFWIKCYIREEPPGYY